MRLAFTNCNSAPNSKDSHKSLANHGDVDGSDTIDPRSIIIKIGSQQQEFDIDELQKLPYFEAMFSSRWYKNGDNINSNMINITGNNRISVCNFNCDDLQLLLAVGQEKKLPAKLKNYVQRLDSLLYCSDFFAMDKSSDYFITKRKIIHFLENQIPSITYDQRKQWLLECKHKRVKESLLEYNDQLKDKATRIHGKVFHYKTFESSNSILMTDEMDETPSLKLDINSAIHYGSMFKVEVIRTGSGGDKLREWKLNVDDTCTRKVFESLKRIMNQFNFKQYLQCFGCLINNLIVITKECTIYDQIIMSNDDYSFFRLLLHSTIRFFVKQRDNINIDTISKLPCVATHYNLIETHYKITHIQYSSNTSYFRLIFEHYYVKYAMNTLKQSDKEKMLLVHIGTKMTYLVWNCQAVNVEREKEGAQGWAKLLITLLPQCSNKFLVENAKIWFPIVYRDIMHHDEDVLNQLVENHVEWIFENILNKLNSSLSFDMAMYLVDFVVYEKNAPALGPKLIEFIEQHSGVCWDIVKQ